MINETWHKRNRMPLRPSAAQRFKWHVTHAKACGCRKLTPAMLRRLELAVAESRKKKVMRSIRGRS